MQQFENNLKIVFGYPIMLVILMWSVYLMDITSSFEFSEFGIYPRTFSGLLGVFFSPLIHSQQDVKHILSNSVPIAVLLASLIYFYRVLSTKILLIIWIFGGLMTWLIARENYHIGMSGVIYGLVGFLFTSGALRKYKPLMGLSLFVVFLYGSLIWGIFPLETKVSFEGHFSGLFVGVVSAFIYRKEGPQNPKLRYEIERELGIEPIDYEKLWREQQAREQDEREKAQKENESEVKDENATHFTYTYIVTPKKPSENKGQNKT